MSDQSNAEMNPAELYREDTYTDQKMGTIRQMTPVTAEGQPDGSREIIFVGSAQIMSPMGAIPITFELPGAKTIGEAAALFAGEAEKAVERTAEELERMRREQQSKIVVPGQGGGGMPPGMGGNSGMGGSGIIT